MIQPPSPAETRSVVKSCSIPECSRVPLSKTQRVSPTATSLPWSGPGALMTETVSMLSRWTICVLIASVLLPYLTASINQRWSGDWARANETNALERTGRARQAKRVARMVQWQRRGPMQGAAERRRASKGGAKYSLEMALRCT